MQASTAYQANLMNCVAVPISRSHAHGAKTRGASWYRGAAVGFVLFSALVLSCAKPKVENKPAYEPPEVSVAQARRRTIVRTVGQPSFVQAYERASIYSKLNAYIKRWYVDIGDQVKQGQVLADLFAPEVEESYRTKAADVEFAKQQVRYAIVQVDVAKANVDVAAARLEMAKAILDKYKAQVWRWKVQVDRLAREVKRTVVDPEVLLESQNQLKASIAANSAAEAEVVKAAADLESRKAAWEEAKVGVDVAKATVDVDTSDWNRLGAWVGYLKLYSPFDGIISARNANTGDFVLPLTGDPTAMERAPHLSPSGNAAPIFVVDRTDVVRVYVDLPERDANYVKKGSKATVLVEAFRDEPIPAAVTRTSWALNFTSRTLRAEIDLVNAEEPKPYWDSGSHQPSPEGGIQKNYVQLLPGMYAYGNVIIERPNVMAIPQAAVFQVGTKNFCWLDEKGKSVRYEVETGISDDKWTEVTQRRAAGGTVWRSFDGSERVILGDLTLLSESGAVRVAKPEARIAAEQ